MEKDKVVVIGTTSWNSGISEQHLRAWLSNKANTNNRILLTLGHYLTKLSKKFDSVRYSASCEISHACPNGTFTGIIAMINQSKIDIGTDETFMDDMNTDLVDFAFPYKLSTVTFLTRKAEYKPQIFGILQTFSLPLWIAIMLTLIAMLLMHYVTFKRRYSFDKILLHVFAILFRQSSVLKPSSMIKQLLVFSWVVGAMFLCLAYESVILSFLSFPPVTQVKDVPQLAKAVKEGHYHCLVNIFTSILGKLLQSTDENLNIIGRDIQTNNLSFGKGMSIVNFLLDRNSQNLALIATELDVAIFNIGRKFVSQDRFLERPYAMPVRKNFCCKKLIENFVHRLMASGLYFKYDNDRTFLFRILSPLDLEEKDTNKRVLTLTDVAPPFMFLIFGHIISFLVFVVEILSNRMKKKYKTRLNISCKEGSN